MENTELKRLEEAALACRKNFATLIEQAEQVLENRRTECRQKIEKSAQQIAALESELELYDALEQERRAAIVRKELATAISTHHLVVDGSRAALRQAYSDYARAFASAGIAAEAAFNAGLNTRKLTA